MLGDDIMHERAGVLDNMLRTFDTYQRSVVALKEVTPAEISSYGCATPEPVGDNLVRILDIVEKPRPAEAPSNLAVMGRYVFTPAIFDALEQVKPGKGGEIQLTDAIKILLADEDGLRLDVHRRPLRHRQQARLPAGHRRAGAGAGGPRA